MIELKTLDTKYCNERDIEVPFLLDFISIVKDASNTLLDVGAHWSHAYYAKQLRELLGNEKAYHAIDFRADEETSAIVDSYFVEDVKNLMPRPTYDLVTCISTLEHVGVYSHIEGAFSEDHVAAKKSFIVQCYTLAKKGLFFTFPYGSEHLVKDHYANITNDFLEFMALSGRVRGYDCEAKWLFNDSPAEGEKWYYITQAEADKVVPDQKKGCQCVCIFQAIRKT